MSRFFVFAVILMILAAGCSKDKKPTPPVVTPGPQVVVVTTDYSTGAISVADADTSTLTLQNDLQAIHSDAVARVFDGLVYVVNRLGGDNVQILDPASSYHTIGQFSVGPGSNPHDIAVVASNRAYVSCNGTPYLLDVDPRTGAIRDSISLLTLADRDHNPDMDRLFYREPYLYVACDRIDYADSTYAPVPPSLLAVVDTRADTLADTDPASPGVQVMSLEGLNPCAPMVWDDSANELLVPECGRYGVLDGGIEKVDLTTWTSRGWMVTESALGGDLIDFAIAPGGHGYATVAVPGGATDLVAFDATSGTNTGVIYHSDTYDLADLVVVPWANLLVVCDRKYQASGLRVYHADTGTAVAGLTQPIPTGLPPFELVIKP